MKDSWWKKTGSKHSANPVTKEKQIKIQINKGLSVGNVYYYWITGVEKPPKVAFSDMTSYIITMSYEGYLAFTPGALAHGSNLIAKWLFELEEEKIDTQHKADVWEALGDRFKRENEND